MGEVNQKCRNLILTSSCCRRIWTGGYTEVCLLFTGPHGFPQPGYYKLDDIGKKLFYTAAEAATLAKSMTEKYERIWGWIGAPEFPMARPWEDLLERKDDSTLDMEIEGRG